MDLLQEKCDRMIETLTKRNVERKLDIEKEREDKKSTNAANEKIDFFENTFAEKKHQIEDALNNSSNIKIEDLPTHFNIISRDILLLQKYVAASNIFLRTYDIKICQQALLDLTGRAKELEDLLMPKRKFGFRSKRRDVKVNGFANKNESNGKIVKDEVDACVNLNSKFLESVCGFANEKDKNLSLESASTLRKDVALTNLENCKVKLFGSPSTVHMNYLKDCFVFCGPVSTSVFVENCSNCTFVVACQQLRLHSSKLINIYLHVTSRAIMEDCRLIYLAPYNLRYENLETDFAISGLSRCVNNWSSVDDFNWLNVEKKSPNWDVMDEIERVSDWADLIEFK